MDLPKNSVTITKWTFYRCNMQTVLFFFCIFNFALLLMLSPVCVRCVSFSFLRFVLFYLIGFLRLTYVCNVYTETTRATQRFAISSVAKERSRNRQKWQRKRQKKKQMNKTKQHERKDTIAGSILMVQLAKKWKGILMCGINEMHFNNGRCPSNVEVMHSLYFRGSSKLGFRWAKNRQRAHTTRKKNTRNSETSAQITLSLSHARTVIIELYYFLARRVLNYAFR